MGIRALTRIVDACARHPWPVIGGMLVLGGVCAIHSIADFSISTDTNRLLPESLPWRHLLADYHKAFPANPILVVVDAPTPELATDATARLTAALGAEAGRPAPEAAPSKPGHASGAPVIRSAEALGSGPFYDRNALLFPSLADTRKLAAELEQARPLLERVAPDPSLRGAAGLAVAEAEAAASGRGDAARTTKLLGGIADAIASVRAGRQAAFSWQAVMADRDAASAKRGFIGVDPILDYHALEPGLAATDRVAAVARDIGLGRRDGARVRLTGEVPINDQQFSALQQGQVTSLVGTSLAVLLILWLALRSFRIIVAVAASLGVGFAVTCTAGLLLVGSFNLLSIAFAVLFVGLGADFGIQFCVRYRAERHERNGHEHDATGGRTVLEGALRSTAEKAGVPLALAAAGTTVGFFSFLPTNYKGVSELGLIAGIGMLVAFGTTMTLLPALLAVLKPPGESRRMGFSAFAPGDRFLSRHRYAVVFGTLAVVLAGTPLLTRLHFDFDPTHMEIPTAPAVETYRDLASSPESGIDTIDVLTPDLASADRLAARLAKLSEVKATHTATSLVPVDQAPKLAAIDALRGAIGPALAQQAVPAPDDRAVAAALAASATRLRALPRAGDAALRAATTRLASELAALADGPAAARTGAADAIARPLAIDLGLLRDAIEARAVTIATLPPAIRADWIAADGKARVEVVPSGDTSDNAVLQRFARAVIRNAPGATSGPVSLVRSRTTVVDAFLVAGISAILAIAVVLFIALRRIGDVLLTLLPLLVAGLVTLEITVLIGEQLNFANIIALPLLLGVGVAFKIYYVMAWRHGATNLLQSTLTRAVVFSALTSATAFGSLWLSPEPGLSSMGKLMALALASTMLAAVLFQPALMGPPRKGGEADADAARRDSGTGTAPERA